MSSGLKSSNFVNATYAAACIHANSVTAAGLDVAEKGLIAGQNGIVHPGIIGGPYPINASSSKRYSPMLCANEQVENIVCLRAHNPLK